MISPHTMWVRIGASTPPVARRSNAHTAPSTIAAKVSIGLQRGDADRDDVDDRGNDCRVVLFKRRVQRAAEEELLGKSVDHGDEHDQRQAALGCELEYLCGIVPQSGDLAGDQTPQDEDATEREADDGAADNRALISAEEPHVSEMQRARHQRAERPHARQCQREPVERAVTGIAASE